MPRSRVLKGKKTAAILEADGRLEASRRDAQAQVVLADASRVAIEKVSAAIANQELPAYYLLGERYIDAIKELSASDNAKSVLIPADLPKALQGLLRSS